MKNLLYVMSAAALLVSCSKKNYPTKPHYTAENKVYENTAKAYSDTIKNPPAKIAKIDSIPEAPQWLGTTNFNLRKPNLVIIHHTAQGSVDETLRTFRLERTGVSAHYVIGKDGSVHHMLNDYLRAWHAGIGSWGNITDVNSISIGIELDNDGFTPFPPAQIQSLMHVLKYLKHKFNIPAANFVGHADIAPSRKDDPSHFFPWKQLSDNGYGLWYDDTTNVQVPPYFDYIEALHVIGYGVSNVPAACQAFRMHFLGRAKGGTFLDADEQKILYCLYRKYMYAFKS